MGDERPPLRLLHELEDLVRARLDYWATRTTDTITASLRPEAAHPLKVKDDGTVMDGNHRIYVLMERGYNVDSLPRVRHSPE